MNLKEILVEHPSLIYMRNTWKSCETCPDPPGTENLSFYTLPPVTDQNWGRVQHSPRAKFPSLKYLKSKLRGEETLKQENAQVTQVGVNFLKPGLSQRPLLDWGTPKRAQKWCCRQYTGARQSSSLLCRTRRLLVYPGRFGNAI